MFSVQEYSFDIATQGLLSLNSLQIAALGLLKVQVDIDIISPPNNDISTYSSLPPILVPSKKTKNLKKRIKVTVTYNDIEYIDYAYTSDLSISIVDIKINPLVEELKAKVFIKDVLIN